jgi:ferredoxin
VRVVVDLDLCEANGVCVSVAPEIFELQSHDTLLVIDPTPAEDLREKVENAVDGCPRAALRLVDE